MGEKASKFETRPHGLHSNTLPLNQVFMTTTQFICSLLHIKNELIYIKYLFSCVTFLLMMPNKKTLNRLISVPRLRLTVAGEEKNIPFSPTPPSSSSRECIPTPSPSSEEQLPAPPHPRLPGAAPYLPMAGHLGRRLP